MTHTDPIEPTEDEALEEAKAHLMKALEWLHHVDSRDAVRAEKSVKSALGCVRRMQEEWATENE